MPREALWIPKGNLAEAKQFIVAASPNGGKAKFPDTPANRILLKMFMLMDEDGNGMLEENECVAIGRILLGDAAAAQAQWDELLREADDDGSGTISVEEWMAWKGRGASDRDVPALEEHYQRLSQTRARAMQQQLTARGAAATEAPPGGNKSVSKRVVVKGGKRTTTTTTVITDAQGNSRKMVETAVVPA